MGLRSYLEEVDEHSRAHEQARDAQAPLRQVVHAFSRDHRQRAVHLRAHTRAMSGTLLMLSTAACKIASGREWHRSRVAGLSWPQQCMGPNTKTSL